MESVLVVWMGLMVQMKENLLAERWGALKDVMMETKMEY